MVRGAFGVFVEASVGALRFTNAGVALTSATGNVNVTAVAGNVGLTSSSNSVTLIADLDMLLSAGENITATADTCDAVADTLNLMTEAYIRGGFQNCEVTTPTTTRTTTPTSTPTRFDPTPCHSSTNRSRQPTIAFVVICICDMFVMRLW